MQRRGAELLVFAAIILITAAVGFGLVLHAGLAPTMATSAAFTAFVGLMMAHNLFRRSQQAGDLHAEIDRLQSELKRSGQSFSAHVSAAHNNPGENVSAAREPVTASIGAEAPNDNRSRKMANRMDGVLGRGRTREVQTQRGSNPSLTMSPQSPANRSQIKASSEVKVPDLPPVSQTAPQRQPATRPSGTQPSAPVGVPPTPPSMISADANQPQSVGDRQSLYKPAPAPKLDLALDVRSAPPLEKPTTIAPTQPPPGGMRDLAASDGPSWQLHVRDQEQRPYLPNLLPGGGPEEPAAFDAHFSPSNAPSSVAQPMKGASKSKIREVDVKKVHSLIKKLAEQVNAVEALSLGRNGRAKPATPQPPRANLHDAQASTRHLPPKAAYADLTPPVASTTLPQAAAGATVAALNNAAETMRTYEPSLDLPNAPVAPARDEQPARQLVIEVSEAIASGRMDILLSPIHGLEDRKAQHYEISISLHDASSATIDVSDLHDALRGTALLPALDSARLVRTAQIGERLARRGHTGALFSDVTGEALDADQFLNVFADAYQTRESFAAQLVIVFQQSDVRRFGDQAWATLSDMQLLGFRFALAGVTDLDMDFAQLKAAGFAFVKLTAQVFLSGLPALGRQIQASNVCQHLGQAGLTLVVDGIAREEDLAKIFGFGVLFGQGELFGGARPVRSKSATSTSQEAAA